MTRPWSKLLLIVVALGTGCVMPTSEQEVGSWKNQVHDRSLIASSVDSEGSDSTSSSSSVWGDSHNEYTASTADDSRVAHDSLTGTNTREDMTTRRLTSAHTTTGAGNEGLIHVSIPMLLLAMTPMLCLAGLSWYLQLDLQGPLVIGIVRVFVQLSVLGSILLPIFRWGMEYAVVVLAYLCFMILLASHEGSQRSPYIFAGMGVCIVIAVSVNLTVMGGFAFWLILKPHPIWNPQYVIPIMGMLLGNCVNGVSLSMNAILTRFVEQASEVELYLSFGANRSEASGRLMREAVRVGTMPMLNSMAVIGLVSIPGMMTGQILGGSPPMEAARYQMFITYLISAISLATILLEMFLVERIAFDLPTDMLRSDRFFKRSARPNWWYQQIEVFNMWRRMRLIRNGRRNGVSTTHDPETLSLMQTDDGTAEKTDASSLSSPVGLMEFVTLQGGLADSSTDPTNLVRLEIRQVARSVPNPQPDNLHQRRTLFRNISRTVAAGEIVAVRGPSGVGKSQLLRIVAGLGPMDDDSPESAILLHQTRKQDFVPATEWRKQVRYVCQYKVDIPGTPRQFIQELLSWKCWKRPAAASRLSASAGASLAYAHGLTSGWSGQEFRPHEDLVTDCLYWMQEWDLDASCLDREWKHLSGGESQRVIVALALATRPQVLLLDESTSSLDLSSKLRVESSLRQVCRQRGMAIILITHDPEQIDRMMQKWPEVDNLGPSGGHSRPELEMKPLESSLRTN